MENVLRIDGSIRNNGSRSSLLADTLVASLGPHRLVERHVGTEPPGMPTEQFLIANHTEPVDRTVKDVAALAESDELIDELLAAGLIVIAAPMYNFSVGPGIKSWVDNLIRKDRTFRITPSGVDRLAEGKRMVVISTRGLAYGPGSPFAECDHLTGWFRDIFGFIGIDDISFISADNLDFGSAEQADASISAARTAITDLVASW